MTTANKITVGRIVLVPVFMVLAYTGHMYAALAVYVFACLSDMADGCIARRCNQITDFGKFMDPLADKILTLSAMCFFIDNGQMKGWAAAIVLFREFAVSGLRLVAAEKGAVIAASPSGKVKTACTMVCLGLMLIMGENMFINRLCTGVIVLTALYSGVEYFIKNRSVFR